MENSIVKVAGVVDGFHYAYWYMITPVNVFFQSETEELRIQTTSVIDDNIDRNVQAKFVSTFYLLVGYYQNPLIEHAKKISAFDKPDGLYYYDVLPFELIKTLAASQRLVKVVTSGIKV